MKEIDLKLVDEIADFISGDAKEKGLTSEELIRYIVGTYVQRMRGVGFDKFIDGMKDRMTKLITENLKKKVRAGEVKCENCTMKLTEKDIDNEKCGSCGAPLLEALGGQHDSA